jgi:hypothetical protein
MDVLMEVPTGAASCKFIDLKNDAGAGKESRTLDLNLGKVALYQLSYSRVSRA